MIPPTRCRLQTEDSRNPALDVAGTETSADCGQTENRDCHCLSVSQSILGNSEWSFWRIACADMEETPAGIWALEDDNALKVVFLEI